MIVLIVVWGIVVWRIGDGLVANCFLLGGALVATVLFVWWTKSTQNFAERNPAQALLDGAQFIEYKKFEAEVQGGGSSPAGPPLEDKGGPSRIGHDHG